MPTRVPALARSVPGRSGLTGRAGCADVFVAGDYCLDLIFTGLAGFPRLGREVVGTGFEMTPGGCYNSVLALHRLGLHVVWAVDFGSDDFSRFIYDRARSDALDESLFVHHPGPLRRVTVVLSYPQDRAFVAFYDPGPRLPAAGRRLTQVNARLGLIPGFYSGPLLTAGARLLHRRGMQIFMDGNTNQAVDLSRRQVRAALRSVDLFLANELEACSMTGADRVEAALRALGSVSPRVVIKAGARGAYALDGDEILHAPAIDVEALETTGAGDCFNAGFIRAWLDGRPMRECLRWGNIVGGLSTLGVGGTGRPVTLDDVRRHL
jgi:sugar/nucleoside kinase (ribokinase family)